MNRQEIVEKKLKQQKRQKKIAILLMVLVVVSCAGGVGYTVYDNYRVEKQKKDAMEKSKKETDAYNVNVEPVKEYLNGLDTDLLNQEITLKENE